MQHPRAGQLLGCGSSKRVVAHASGANLVARSTHRLGESLLHEMRAMRALKHHHLLALQAADSLGTWIEAPIAPFGSFVDFVDALEFEGDLAAVTEQHVEVAVCQVASGLAHMNSVGLWHNDVAARNVLVFEFERGRPRCMLVKLADFGSVSVCGSGCEDVAALRQQMLALTADL
jgi:serine/threonine protein kinase